MADNFDLLDPTVPTIVLDGTLDAQTVDNDGDANKVLKSTVNNAVRVNWQITGTLVPLLSGQWEVESHFESIGPGDEFDVPVPISLGGPGPIVVPYNPGNGTYVLDIALPAGTITPGPYKAVVLLSFRDTLGNLSTIAGFVDLPMIRFQ